MIHLSVFVFHASAEVDLVVVAVQVEELVVYLYVNKGYMQVVLVYAKVEKDVLEEQKRIYMKMVHLLVLDVKRMEYMDHDVLEVFRKPGSSPSNVSLQKGGFRLKYWLLQWCLNRSSCGFICGYNFRRYKPNVWSIKYTKLLMWNALSWQYCNLRGRRCWSI